MSEQRVEVGERIFRGIDDLYTGMMSVKAPGKPPETNYYVHREDHLLQELLR